jgi:diguanylate cyclase (GGDEF)-like protein
MSSEAFPATGPQPRPILPPRRAIVWVAVAAGLLVHLGHTAFGLGGGAVGDVIERHLQCALVLAGAVLCWTAAGRRGQRAPHAWRLMAIGIAAWGAGLVYYDFHLLADPSPPYPSAADAGWLAFYPFAYAAILLLSPVSRRTVRVTLAVDGVIAALAVAAATVGLVYRPIVAATGASSASVAMNLAYPVADLVLLGLVLGVFAVHGWRPGRQWLVLAAGLIVLVVADAAWAWDVAEGTYRHGHLLDSAWPVGMLVIGLAGWVPSGAAAPVRPDGWGALLAPLAFGLVALGTLAYGEAHPLGWAAAALALSTLMVVIGRTALAFREVRSLAGSRQQARTDDLTGLPNRRAFMEDLRAACAGSERWVLALFDLDGFKSYNDTYGHPAGDALLSRLGCRLSQSCGHGHRAYRLGGDEFCVLGRGTADQVPALLRRALDALSESGEGFSVRASHGVSLIPAEAFTADRALHIADQRMYGQKSSRDRLALDETRALLLSVLDAQQPQLHEHSDAVGELATGVGERLGLTARELEHVRQAAALHDIGKVAIPTEILNKPGPLSEREWRLMRTHTLIGQRILGALPRLADVGLIVRSSHERWDGNGYPDGLARDEIPAGARIIAACDAWEAMTEDRVYRTAMSREDALAELRRGSGTQFDPAVVAALVELLAG